VTPPKVPRPTPAERYQTDPAFHTLVSFIRGTLERADYTASELREAVMLAAQIHEMNTIRPYLFRRPWEG
jgi:hypothetical protein